MGRGPFADVLESRASCKASKTSNLENQGNRGELLADDNARERPSLERIYRFGTELATSSTASARVVRSVNGKFSISTEIQNLGLEGRKGQ